MTFHDYIDLGLLLAVIIPLWGYAARWIYLHGEYPLHLHDERDNLNIKYPKGFEPPEFRNEGRK